MNTYKDYTFYTFTVIVGHTCLDGKEEGTMHGSREPGDWSTTTRTAYVRRRRNTPSFPTSPGTDGPCFSVTITSRHTSDPPG